VDIDDPVPGHPEMLSRLQVRIGGALGQGGLQAEGLRLPGQGPGPPRVGPQEDPPPGLQEARLGQALPPLDGQGRVLRPPGKLPGDPRVPAAGVEPGQGLPLRQDDPANARPGKVEGRGQARDAAAHDEDLRLFQDHPVSGAIVPP